MSKEIIKDGRIPIGGIGLRRMGDRAEAVPKPSVSEAFRTRNYKGKNLKLPIHEAQVIQRLAEAADLVGLTYQEGIALVIVDAESLIPNGTIRVKRLVDILGRPIQQYKDIVGNEERAELFAKAREIGIEKPQE